MTNFINNAFIALVVLVVAILVVLAWQGLRRPVLAKIGLRNIPRRPAQSILIVVGLTLSTIIIISALSVGDTLNYSVQRQAVAAYGEVDEIIAPPLLSLLASLGESGQNQPASNQATATGSTTEQTANEQQQQLENLTAGGLTSVLTVLEGGLPGITMERYAQLQTEAAQEPLIDGVAGSILFPTIIRNTSTGQGEPLGFVFAVDQAYDQQFGVTTVEGQSVTMAALKPGVGNIFLQASNVFGIANDLAQRAGLNTSVSDLALAVAGIGAVLTTGGEGLGNVDLSSLSVTTSTLQSLGINTAPLEAQGIQTVTLAALGITTDTLRSLGQQIGITDTAAVQPTALLSNTLGLDVSQVASATTNLLSSFNLNTLGREIDSALAPYGLQLRQGDVYLNRLGAQRLAAQPGDVLEIFVGPLPIPMRVKAVVEEAGPIGAVLPVVMMRLDEAQKLFFMNGRVNNVLISNRGDELTGLEHTDAVSKRLRVLAMDEDALNQVVTILRRPAVQASLTAAATNARQSIYGDDPNDGPPAWLAPIIESVSPLGGMIEQIEQLPAALAQPGISDELRTVLSEQSLRGWLLSDNRLAAQDEADLRAALGKLNQFDLIDGFNKSTVVTVSTAAGGIFASVFTLFGIFSIIAAVMLIFLIFVMLATERRTEMGISRAIGVQRSHLVQMFVTEGMVYDLLAAAIGVALGLAVSYAMIDFLGRLFNDVAGQFGSSLGILQFHFRVAPRSIIVGYCLGVLFTYLVVTFSSWRVSRLNIVSAIRNLPEEANAKRRSLLSRIGRWTIGPLFIAAGAGVLYYASLNTVVTLWQIGATLLLTGVVFLLARIFDFTPWREQTEQRIVYTLIGLGLLVIWAAPWNQLIGRSGFDVLRNDQAWIMASLALTGPLLIIGAILAIMYNADVITWLVSRLLSGFSTLTPVLRMAIAYPLSARFRTGMAMVMFAMIIATVVLMAVVIQATQSLITLDEKDSAGFEISTSNTLLSFFNPLADLASALPEAASDYPQLANIANVGSFVSAEALAQQTAPDQPSSGRGFVAIAGLDDGYLQQAAQVYTFQRRAAGFADDAAVWQALRERDDVAIVTPDLIEQIDASVNYSATLFGQTITKTVDANAVEFEQGQEPGRVRRDGRFYGRLLLQDVDLTAGELPLIELAISTLEQPTATHKVQVIGVLVDDQTLAAEDMQMSRAGLSALVGSMDPPSNFYVKVKPGADVKAVAQEVERAFLSSGLDAGVMAENFALGQSITRGILRLFQGFMALGLLVGIAALGVIATRTVVERRQQIGVLRSIGFQSNMVALALVLESSFIALAGLLIGAATGLLLGNSIITTFFTDITPDTQFTLPWWQIGGILLAAYLFALVTTIVPAYQAARIYPAEALRYE